MNKRITFRNMDKSDVMEQYANQQLKKVEEFLSHERSPIHIDLVFEPSKVREHHKVELRVKSPSYEAYSSYEYQGTGFYDVLDRVIDTMYEQLHEQKRRLVNERKVEARAEEFRKKR